MLKLTSGLTVLEKFSYDYCSNDIYYVERRSNHMTKAKAKPKDGVVIGRPRMATQIRVLYSVDSELNKEFVALTNRQAVNRSQLVREMMKAYIKSFAK